MNDERPIEKLLRRAAQKRNDEAGPPPELHPANRRLLQAEVARQFPQPAASPAPAGQAFWVALTRRWAYALLLLPIISVLALVLVPLLAKKSPAPMELAQTAPAESAAMPAILADAPLSVAPETTTTSFVADKEARVQAPPGASSGGNRAPTAERMAITAPPLAPLPAPRANAPDAAAGATVAANNLASDRDAGRLDYRREEKTAVVASRATKTKPVASPVPATVASSAAPASRSFSGPAAAAPTALASDTGASLTKQRAKTETAVVANALNAPAKDAPVVAAEPVGDVAGAVALNEAGAEGNFADKTWLARGGGADRQRATLNSQAYSNLSAAAAAKRQDQRASPLTPPVLQNFQIQQQGRDLRIVDGDGSIYRGVVDEENTLYKQMSARQQQKLAIANDSKFNLKTPKQQTEVVSALKKLEQETFYLYRVEGTNRTLNQNVVFTWNFVDTNMPAAGSLNYQNAAQKFDAAKLPEQFPALLQNSLINGRAQFGAGRAVEVNAVPVQP